MKRMTVGGALLALLWLGGCASLKGGEGPEYVLTYAESHPESYPTTQGGLYFASLVEERSEGRICIEMRAGGKLGDEESLWEQLKLGGIDFARVSLSPLAEDIPELDVLFLPYLYRDGEHMWEVLDGPLGDGFLERFKEAGAVGLSWYDGGARNFYNRLRPVSSPEDMAGLKIRIQESDMMESLIYALGAQPVREPFSQVYSDLETGKIDGAENNWASYESSGHYRVAGYYTVDGHSRVPEVQLASGSTWEKLSKEDQELILQCARESALYQRQLWQGYQQAAREKVIRAGCRVTELTEEESRAFKEAVAPVYERYGAAYEEFVQAIRDTGPEGVGDT